MTKASMFAALVGLAMVCGCGQDTADPNPAEVPSPGPAAMEDPGPAPDGQWEPPLDGALDPPGETPPAEAASEAPPTAEPAAPVKDGISLRLQDWEATQELIASHKGKVVVVDFWATSCLPCRREFPHLVELQKSRPDKVACVSVSLDYSGRKSRPPEMYRESVLEFLKEQNATIDNVLSIDDPDELEDRLKLPPIPLVWVYDRSGEHRKTFDNGDLAGDEFTYADDVVPFVDGLLAEN